MSQRPASILNRDPLALRRGMELGPECSSVRSAETVLHAIIVRGRLGHVCGLPPQRIPSSARYVVDLGDCFESFEQGCVRRRASEPLRQRGRGAPTGARNRRACAAGRVSYSEGRTSVSVSMRRVQRRTWSVRHSAASSIASRMRGSTRGSFNAAKILRNSSTVWQGRCGRGSGLPVRCAHSSRSFLRQSSDGRAASEAIRDSSRSYEATLNNASTICSATRMPNSRPSVRRYASSVVRQSARMSRSWSALSPDTSVAHHPGCSYSWRGLGHSGGAGETGLSWRMGAGRAAGRPGTVHQAVDDRACG